MLALLKLGIAGHLVHVGLVTYGIHWSTAFSSSLILGCGPVFTLLILRFSGIEPLTRGQVAGVAVALMGVLLFMGGAFALAALRCSRLGAAQRAHGMLPRWRCAAAARRRSKVTSGACSSAASQR